MVAQSIQAQCWASLLGNEKAAGLLHEILNEEKAANEKLNELALGGNNEEALAGTYEYCLVVDGQWMADPLARETVANPYGGRNSVLRVAGPFIPVQRKEQ